VLGLLLHEGFDETCEHSSETSYELLQYPAGVRFCRICAKWTVIVDDAFFGEPPPRARWQGAGIEDYRFSIEEVARMLPSWNATFLYGLGGHAHEVA
jgi:hypothetical protein